MKILLGAHGTGKTTLLREVAKSYPLYYVTDGFSRPVVKVGEKLELPVTDQQVIINELSAWAYKNYLEHTNVISTRSIVDCIIYSRILFPGLDIEELEDLFEETKHKVEHFFYIPVEFEYVEDAQRPAGKWQELQSKIDHVIQDFITAHIPAEKVVRLTGTVEERFNQISKYL